MKRYAATLSNGMECIVVADSFSQASLCVANMLFKTDEYRREDFNQSLRVGDAYTIKEIEE
jgi:hypothetical protein